jgi:hypothetical protein
MQQNIIKVLYIARESNDQLIQMQQALVDLIQQEKQRELQTLMVYAADDIMIKRFGNAWIDYLIEKSFYNTDTGSNKFLVQTNEYIRTADYNMLRIVAFIMKSGFCYSESIYMEVLRLLNISNETESRYTPYIPHTNYDQPISKLRVIVPTIVAAILLTTLELSVFYNIQRFWRGI